MAKAKEGTGGPNCGVGSGGFQPGNTCAAGDGAGGGKAPAGKKPPAKKLTPAQKERATEKKAKERAKAKEKAKKEREKAKAKKVKEREKAKAKKKKELEKAKKVKAAARVKEAKAKARADKKTAAAEDRKKKAEQKAGDRAKKQGDKKKEVKATKRKNRHLDDRLDELREAEVGMKKRPGETSSQYLLRSKKDHEKVQELQAGIRQHIKDSAAEGTIGPRHGMDEGQKTVSVTARGVTFHAEDHESLAALVESTREMPPELTRHTKAIVSTRQTNNQDPHWKQEYKDFKYSAATGGDGEVVVYKGRDTISPRIIAHEMGHNLDYEGGFTGGPGKVSGSSAWKKASLSEEPVTEYARNGANEDFAESVAYYISSPSKFAKDYPLKYAIIHKLIGKK